MAVTVCDIYVSFRALCAIQTRLFIEGFGRFGWDYRLGLHEQSEQVGHYSLGLCASVMVLSAWGRIPAGYGFRREMDEVMEGGPQEGLEDSADKMLRLTKFDTWKDLVEPRGYWLVLANQRYQ